MRIEKNIRKKIFSTLGVVLMVASLTACSSSKSSTSSTNTQGSATTALQASNISTDYKDVFTDRDLDSSYDESSSVKIDLSNPKSTNGVSIESDKIVIKSEGTYVISGNTTKYQVVVEADDTSKVQIVLNNANITMSNRPAIYVKSGDKVFVTIKDGTKNSLKTTGDFTTDGDTNTDAVIFSKSDMTINGNGELDIDSTRKNGVTSKDDLKITGGKIKISAENHGIEGKDSVAITKANINIISGQDGINSDYDSSNSESTDNATDKSATDKSSSNSKSSDKKASTISEKGSSSEESSNATKSSTKPDKGYVYIMDGEISIEAGDDGIHSEKNVVIDGGNIDISKSNEGIEGEKIYINGGNTNVKSSDDGLNATSSTTSSDSLNGSGKSGNGSAINGKSVDSNSSDNKNGTNSSPDTTSGATKTVEKGGVESADLVSNAEVNTDTENGSGINKYSVELASSSKSTDTSQNGQDNQNIPTDMPDGMRQRGKGMRPQMNGDMTPPDGKMGGNKMGGGSMENNPNALISINGGKVTIDAEGDGIDSNGSLEITGGEVYVNGPESRGNGALDYNGDAKITGGTLVALGSGGMDQNMGDSSTQGSMLVSQSGSAGTKVVLKDSDGNEILSYTATKSFNSIVISSPKIKKGETYTLTVGSNSQSIKMDSLIYGQSNEQGNFRR